jgi:hypothetical protein
MSRQAQRRRREASPEQRVEPANSGRRGASQKRTNPFDVTNSLRDGLFLLATAALLTACTAEPQQQPATNTPVEQPAPPPPAPRAPAPTPLAANILTSDGYGPLRIGMTRAQITEALGSDANPQAIGGADPEQCDQYRPAKAPEGMLVIVEQGRLTRISLIRQSKVKTDKGLGIGATPDQVRAAYGSSLQASPHKYVEVPAQYLTVWEKGGSGVGGPVAPTSRGIVYEVDASGKVALIHAGGPSITYVEGCS